MISLKKLTKVYDNGFTALQDINLEIGTGMFGLLGPNGAGKTTLMRIMAGLLRPTSGQIVIGGYNATTEQGRQSIKEMLGYLPQDFGLYPDLTAWQFLDYVGHLKGIDNRQIRHRQIEELLDLVRLTKEADRKLKAFSGGMRRRVGIAQTLLGNPKLLIVDEPTVGLDPEERVHFRNMLTEAAHRCTVILSTHVIEDISHSCNDLAIIEKGTVLFRGSPMDLIREVRGNTWIIRTNSELSDSGLTVTSTVHLQDTIQYRVLGTPDAHYAAIPAEPGLEDGYIWMMSHAKHEPLRGQL